MSPTAYIHLDAIRLSFARYFEGFGIELPEKINVWGDFTHGSGWSITYALGYAEVGQPCIYISADHRMTNPRHFLIQEDGEIKTLSQFQEAYGYDPAIPDDEAVKREAYYQYNRRVASQYRLYGLGGNFDLQSATKAEADEAKAEGAGFHFFWETSSPFSQWHRCSFTAFGITFNTAEQYMMHQKALLFGDEAIAAQILAATNPRAQKALGRQIAGFDERTWKANCRRIVYAANCHKFRQNPDLLAALRATGDQLLVEASPDDSIWGIGLAADDPRAQDPATWLGTNWLGEVLTLLREDIARDSA